MVQLVACTLLLSLVMYLGLVEGDGEEFEVMGWAREEWEGQEVRRY